jgi:general secretion pathway protein A
MYIEHFGLSKLPFENVPDPAFFFNHGDYHRIRSRLENSLKAGRGLILVTGPIGSGKTTLSQMIKPDLSDGVKLIWTAEPPRNSKDLMIYLIQELGLKPSPSKRVFYLRDIREALLNINSNGGKCLMIIDESHLISDDTLNGIRLLNNLEEGSSKLIQVLLLGQEELIEKINQPEMEPFKQRIAALEIIGKMSADRVRKYVTHRLRVAEGDPSILTKSGWEAIGVAFSNGGIPRTINTLCDQSFIVAHEKNKTKISAHDVYEATKRMGLKTDVFHYIVALKSKKQKVQTQSATISEFESETETLRVGPDEMPGEILGEHNISENEVSRWPQAFMLKTDQKGIKMPILFLVISIMALVFSIFFYYQRSASPDLMTCLTELITF